MALAVLTETDGVLPTPETIAEYMDAKTKKLSFITTPVRVCIVFDRSGRLEPQTPNASTFVVPAAPDDAVALPDHLAAVCQMLGRGILDQLLSQLKQLTSADRLADKRRPSAQPADELQV